MVHPMGKETYAATENNGTPSVVSSDIPVEQNLVDEELDNVKPKISAKTKTKAEIKSTSVPEKSITKSEEESFDVVPSSKIPEIAERVKYAYDILRRFGRAYDYRTTTLSELKKILQDLEGETSKQVSRTKS